MQPEKSIQIEHRLARNINARPHRVILRLAIRHANIQTISRPARKDHDQAFSAHTRFNRAHGSASQKARHGHSTDHGESAVTKKNPTSNGHKNSSPQLPSLKFGRTEQ